jgi:rod shape-determining protein MreC
MPKKSNFYLIFSIFLGLSLILILLFRTGNLNLLTGAASYISNPIQKITHNIFHNNLGGQSDMQKLVNENAMVRKQLVDQAILTKENKALRDQFQTQYPISLALIPANIIGSPGLIPGISKPEYFILNKGTKDGVKLNQPVISNDMLVGKIILVQDHLSKVELVFNKATSFTAKAVSYQTGMETLGVLKGRGNEEMILDNVLLSDSLKQLDTVVTKGDIDQNGFGFPPNLIVGKIVSVEKQESDLFQKAKIRSPLDFSSLSIVFVITK